MTDNESTCEQLVSSGLLAGDSVSACCSGLGVGSEASDDSAILVGGWRVTPPILWLLLVSIDSLTRGAVTQFFLM